MKVFKERGDSYENDLKQIKLFINNFFFYPSIKRKLNDIEERQGLNLIYDLFTGKKNLRETDLSYGKIYKEKDALTNLLRKKQKRTEDLASDDFLLQLDEEEQEFSFSAKKIKVSKHRESMHEEGSALL